MEITTTMRYNFIPIRAATLNNNNKEGKQVFTKIWKNWKIYIVGGNLKWLKPCGKLFFTY